MISSVNSLSSSSLSLLFGVGRATETKEAGPGAGKPLKEATGYTADVLKAGNAIGKIIEIVAGMKQSDTLFTMEGATRIDGSDGGYRLTKTGTGTTASDAEFKQTHIDLQRQLAVGTGPEAERARAYVRAREDGTFQEIDLSAHGVSTVMTQTEYYAADGTQIGWSGNWKVTGLDEFLDANTYAAEDGTLRDKATGKYASVGMNGTKYTYEIY